MFLKKKIDYFLSLICVILMSLLVINVFGQVIARYVFNSPSPRIDGLTLIIFLWLILLGSTYTAGQHKHLSIESFQDWLSPDKKPYLNILKAAITLIFAFLFMVYGGYNIISKSAATGQTIPAIGFELKYVYLAFPISGLCLMFYGFYDLLSAWQKPVINDLQNYDSLSNDKVN